jgi:hypothetical protein
MSISKIFVTIIVSFLASSVLIFKPMLMDWTIRNQTEQIARAKLSPIRSELYTPQGAVVLHERQGFLPPDYFGGFNCFEGRINILYGTDRLTDEIREEYAHGLTESHWELDPGYKPDENYIVYKKGNEFYLTIDLLKDSTEPVKQDFKLIYSIFLTYVNLPYHSCKG